MCGWLTHQHKGLTAERTEEAQSAAEFILQAANPMLLKILCVFLHFRYDFEAKSNTGKETSALLCASSAFSAVSLFFWFLVFYILGYWPIRSFYKPLNESLGNKAYTFVPNKT